jgi:hypothetical protein
MLNRQVTFSFNFVLRQTLDGGMNGLTMLFGVYPCFYIGLNSLGAIVANLGGVIVVSENFEWEIGRGYELKASLINNKQLTFTRDLQLLDTLVGDRAIQNCEWTLPQYTGLVHFGNFKDILHPLYDNVLPLAFDIINWKLDSNRALPLSEASAIQVVESPISNVAASATLTELYEQVVPDSSAAASPIDSAQLDPINHNSMDSKDGTEKSGDEVDSSGEEESIQVGTEVVFPEPECEENTHYDNSNLSMMIWLDISVMAGVTGFIFFLMVAYMALAIYRRRILNDGKTPTLNSAQASEGNGSAAVPGSITVDARLESVDF